MDAMGALGMGIFGIFYFLFMIAYLGISIYVIILFIKTGKTRYSSIRYLSCQKQLT